MADVLARAETVRAGDRIFTPCGSPAGYEVDAVNEYEDGSVVIVYRTGRSSSMRFGGVLCRTENVTASLAPLKMGERLRCRRGGSEHRPEPA